MEWDLDGEYDDVDDQAIPRRRRTVSDTYSTDQKAYLARLGIVLRTRRTQLGLRQRQVGERSGYSQHHIREIENGRYAMRVVALRDIAHALDTTPMELLSQAEQAETEGS